MLSNFREFQVGPDPYGRTWNVKLVWLQTAISIRHSDSVDVKFLVGDGDDKDEKVIAIMHPKLLELSAKLGRPLNDAWCLKLAAFHLRSLILTGNDIEKSLVTMTMEDMERANRELDSERATAPA